jgi:hypothetical protein
LRLLPLLLFALHQNKFPSPQQLLLNLIPSEVASLKTHSPTPSPPPSPSILD